MPYTNFYIQGKSLPRAKESAEFARSNANSTSVPVWTAFPEGKKHHKYAIQFQKNN